MAWIIQNDEGEPLRFWEIVAGFAYFVGLLAIAVFAMASKSWQVFGVLWLVGTAAWISGTLLGFLFGVPKFRSEDTPGQPSTGSRATTTEVTPNTNLEQISDWLTKIIIGATLVQLRELSTAIGQLASFVGEGLGPVSQLPTNASVSGAAMIFFFGAGFIWGYLWCSLRIFREMQNLINREKRVLERAASTSSD